MLAHDFAAARADDVAFANNLAPAAEVLLPELADIRAWLADQVGEAMCSSRAAARSPLPSWTPSPRPAASPRLPRPTAGGRADEPLRPARRRRSGAVIMGFLARLSRVVPLLIIMAVAAGLIYVVVTYRHSPARAKEVLIKIFTWFNGASSSAFSPWCRCTPFSTMAPAVLDLSLSFMIVGLVGLLITRIANWRFLKHNPNYRKKRLAATTRRRWPWGK